MAEIQYLIVALYQAIYLCAVMVETAGGFMLKGVQRLACLLCRSCVLYIRTAAGRGDRGQIFLSYKL